MGDMVSGLKKLRKKLQTNFANAEADEGKSAPSQSQSRAPVRDNPNAEAALAETLKRNEAAAANEEASMEEAKRKALKQAGYKKR